MPPQPNIQSHHAPVTPSPSSSTATSTPESSPGSSSSFLKPSFFSWRVLGGIFATMLVVGWVFIIVILIQEEKWQLVLVAWLLLYAAAHFCYWYFKRHHLLSIQSQICGRTRGNVGSMRELEKGCDAPPSYEDIIKSEAPPPAYYSVVEGSPKFSHKQTTSTGFPLFSLQGLPKVFGKSATASSPASSPSTSTEPGTSTSSSNSSSDSSLKKAHRGKFPSCSSSSSSPSSSSSSLSSNPSCSSYHSPLASSISGALPHEQSKGWKSYRGRRDPPSYSDSFLNIESQVISPRSHTPSFPPTRTAVRSVSKGRAETVMNEALRPIFSPIYKNTTSSSSSNSSSKPQTSQISQVKREITRRISLSVDDERPKDCSAQHS